MDKTFTSPKTQTCIFLISAILLCLVLYWPTLNGGPIWDDLSYWFFDPTMGPKGSYHEIWEKYNWPVTATLQKFTFSLWGENFYAYHVLNLFLHGTNALLLFFTAKKINFPFPKILFLLFLLHPANVISVAWMIQLKTLLCFLFGILSFFYFDKGLREKKWFILSFVFFALSLLSKSSSITLPLIFFIHGFKELRFKVILFLLPFFLLSGIATYRLLMSETTKATVGLTLEPEPVIENEPVATPVPEPEIELAPEEKPLMSLDFQMMLKSLRYYFWETLIPYNTVPVKGEAPHNLGTLDYLHLPLIILCLYLGLKVNALWSFIAGHILLLPYLGIVPAPYMNITWVSDQHLYLVLPFFLIFWTSLVSRLPRRGALVLGSATLVFFAAKTFETGALYKDEVAFYEASLTHAPENVPIAYNLAESLTSQGRYDEARDVINDMFELAKASPEIESNIYWPELIELNQTIQNIHENSTDNK